MMSFLQVLGFALVITRGNLLVEVSFLVIFILALIWIITVQKLAKGLALQFLDGQTYKTKKILKNLADKLKLQESTIQQAEKALEKLGDNSQEFEGAVIEGPLGLAIKSLHDKLDSLRMNESKQNWVSKGIALIAEIRKNETQLENYTLHVTSTIARYANANQAAFFILENHASLKLSATFAYDKSKFTKGDMISIENGLLGQCVTEKQPIYVAQVPKNYVKIASGLGEATPKCLALVPLVHRDQVYGVIEIAFLKDLEPQHQEFLQKASEEIASELAALQIQSHTKKLLEQAQEQAEQLTANEEELKQNMEEMQATQEEMRRKEIALQEKLDEIEGERTKNQAILETCMDAVVSFTVDGTIEFCNRAGEEMLGYSRYELASHSIFNLLNLHLSFQGDEPVLLSKTGNQITTRSEVNTTDRNGEELSLLLTATHIKLKEKSLFTLFAQKISVDLF
jgi:PAS domain S-box-containing protein